MSECQRNIKCKVFHILLFLYSAGSEIYEWESLHICTVVAFRYLMEFFSQGFIFVVSKIYKIIGEITSRTDLYLCVTKEFVK